jgi:hypothetical protein
MLRSIRNAAALVLALMLGACGGGGGMGGTTAYVPAVAVAVQAPAPVSDDTASVQAMVDKGNTVTGFVTAAED